MGRTLKPLPKNRAIQPKKNVTEIEARRSFVWQLLLNHADVRTIRAEVGAKYGVGKDTIEDDVRALRAEAATHFEEQRASMLALTLEQLDRIALELRQTAQEAKLEGERSVRVAALAAARQTLKDKAQIAGLVVQKQEVTGAVATLNVHVDADPAQAAAFVRALKHAHLAPDDAASMIDA